MISLSEILSEYKSETNKIDLQQELLICWMICILNSTDFAVSMMKVFQLLARYSQK